MENIGIPIIVIISYMIGEVYKLISKNKYKVYALSDNDSLIVNSLNDDIVRHYDSLIDENNDPVHDSKPLRDYMDK